jgi:aminomethyltransferase
MKRTPLYEAHRSLGARLVEFAGWEMPVQYGGIVKEHLAVRGRAGLFDVSHMGEIELRGRAALAACQWLTPNDVGRLRDGEAQYSLLLLPSGGILDDVIIYRRSEECFLFCVNAANRERDYDWMREHARGVDVVDRSDEFALLALQGPRATAVLSRLTRVDLDRPRFSFVEGEVVGRHTLIARTGYTGEDGWELYCAPESARALWDDILNAGEPDGILPAGLGARDTLRLEAALPLYGHELSEAVTPLEARLSWVVRFDKGDFLGCDALRRKAAEPRRRHLVGIALVETGVPRSGYAVWRAARRVGELTSGTKSPSLGKGIGLGYVDDAEIGAGAALEIEIRARKVKAEVVRLPFYRRRN